MGNNFLIMCMGKPLYFSAIFTKGTNFYDFLFASVDDETLTKWAGKDLRTRICSHGGNCLLYELTSIFWVYFIVS